jgi:hypothetical protein
VANNANVTTDQVYVEVHIPARLWELPLVGRDILDAWTNHAQELADEQKKRVQDRTPVDTGTLQGSAMGIGGVDHSYPKRTLAEVFFDPQQQLDGPWHRQYDVYQETEPLGKSTYTRWHAQMLYRSGTDDLKAITDWATKYAQEAIDVWTAAAVTVP